MAKPSQDAFVSKFAVDSFESFKIATNDKGKKCLPWDEKTKRWSFGPIGKCQFVNIVIDIYDNHLDLSSGIKNEISNIIGKNAQPAMKIEYFDDFVLTWLQKAMDLVAINLGEKVRLKYLEDNGVSGKNYKKSEEVYETTVLKYLNKYKDTK